MQRAFVSCECLVTRLPLQHMYLINNPHEPSVTYLSPHSISEISVLSASIRSLISRERGSTGLDLYPELLPNLSRSCLVQPRDTPSMLDERKTGVTTCQLEYTVDLLTASEPSLAGTYLEAHMMKVACFFSHHRPCVLSPIIGP